MKAKDLTLSDVGKVILSEDEFEKLDYPFLNEEVGDLECFKRLGYDPDGWNDLEPIEDYVFHEKIQSNENYDVSKLIVDIGSCGEWYRRNFINGFYLDRIPNVGWVICHEEVGQE